MSPLNGQAPCSPITSTYSLHAPEIASRTPARRHRTAPEVVYFVLGGREVCFSWNRGWAPEREREEGLDPSEIWQLVHSRC